MNCSGNIKRLICALFAAVLAQAAPMPQALAGSISYSYDALGRLISVSGPGYTVSYSYDAAGNRLQQVSTLTIPVPGPLTVPVPENATNYAITPSLTGPAATSVSVSSSPSHGAVSTSGLAMSYTPTGGYWGSDSFQYTASNSVGTSAPATVTITVVQATIAGATSATVAYGSTGNPITLNVSGGAATSVAVSSQAAHGTATASGTSITYTPTSGYSGSDSFQYTATNFAGSSAPATVSISVVQTPIAGASSATVAYGSTGNPITLNLSGGAPTSMAVSTQAAHGTATASGTSITYTPTSGYTGSDSFQYTATNVIGTSAPATVSITVVQAPIAGAASATVAFGSAGNPITLNLSGGAPTSVAVSSQAAHGTATASGTSITYTPTSGYSGSDSFQYKATNVIGTSAAATVSITVNPQAPIASPAAATVAYGSSGNPITLSLSGGAPTSVTVSSQAAHGTATASGTSITYTPNSGYWGSDSFQYKAANAGGTSIAATVSITINPQIPITGAASATVAYGSTGNAITLNLSGGAATSVAVSSQAAHGTATASGTSITYTPASGYWGSDSFQYTASNVGGTSSAGTVGITVNTPPAPSMTGSCPTTTAGGTISINLASVTTSAVTSWSIVSGSIVSNGGNGTGTAWISGSTLYITAPNYYVIYGDPYYEMQEAPVESVSVYASGPGGNSAAVSFCAQVTYL